MIHPIGFIGCIFTYIWLTCMAHVGTYATHGSCGYVKYNSDSMNLELSLVLMLCPGCILLSFPSCPAQPGPSGSAPFMESARRPTHYHFSTSPTTAFNMLKIYHGRRRSCSLSITALWILHLESLQRRTVWGSRREPFLTDCMFLSGWDCMLHKDPESARVIFSFPPQALFPKVPFHIFVLLLFSIKYSSGGEAVLDFDMVGTSPPAAFANQIICCFLSHPSSYQPKKRKSNHLGVCES